MFSGCFGRNSKRKRERAAEETEGQVTEETAEQVTEQAVRQVTKQTEKEGQQAGNRKTDFRLLF